MKTINKFFMVNSHSLAIAVFIILIGFSSCKKNDNTDMKGTVSYTGSFVKSGDAVLTSASGTATATFNPNTLVLSYKLSWSGLGSNAAGMHFHDAGPVIVHIEGFTTTNSGTISGIATLTDNQATDLAAGKIYAQIHTVNIPAGEIKATLSKSGSTGSTDTSGGGYGY